MFFGRITARDDDMQFRRSLVKPEARCAFQQLLLDLLDKNGIRYVRITEPDGDMRSAWHRTDTHAARLADRTARIKHACSGKRHIILRPITCALRLAAICAESVG